MPKDTSEAPLRLEVRDLRLMEAVGDLGSMTRASEQLSLTQSALSHQLRRLEERLGARLFERVGGRLRPTASGSRLIEGGRALLLNLRELQTSVSHEAATSRQQLRVSASCSTHYAWLARALGSFTAQHRGVDIDVAHHHRDNEATALRRGTLDLVVGAHPPTGAEFETLALFALETVALVGSRHRLADRAGSPGGLRWKDLAGERLLIHDLPAVDELALRAGIDGEARNRSTRATLIERLVLTEAIVELAGAGHGIGLIGRWIGKPPVDLRRLVVVTPRPVHRRQLWATWIQANPRKLPLQALANWISSSAETPR